LGVIKREFTYCYIHGSGGIDEMTSREILEYVIELLTMQMKLENNSNKHRRASRPWRRNKKGVVQQIGGLKKRESELISEFNRSIPIQKKINFH